jgi:hypothetical protein
MAKPVLSRISLVSKDPNPITETLARLGGTVDAKKCGRGPEVRTIQFNDLAIEITHDPGAAPAPNPPVLVFAVSDRNDAGAAVKELFGSGIGFTKLCDGIYEIRMPEATIRLERHDDALVEALKQETDATTG